MNGLSSTALQNTTSLAQPIEFSSPVSAAVRLIMPPMAAIASMFEPARVEPTLTEAQTRLVAASASGMAAKQIGVDLGHAFLDMGGEAADEIDIDGVRGAIERFGQPQQILRAERPAIREIGVTAMRLLMIGSPNSSEMSALTRRRSRAIRSTLS